LFNPRSYGTIFSDTLINPTDTLLDGAPDPSAEYASISVFETGAYAQLTNSLFNEKLKLIGSMRLDKSQNYDWQYSPRMSMVYTHKAHNFRISAQQAFRSPTLQNQYLLLDIGPIILSGNLNGADNMYTYESFNLFNDLYDSSYVVDATLLETLAVEAVKPEQVRSLELGYRGIVHEGFYVDISGYYNVYSNFIGNIRGYRMLGDAVAGEESGMDAILTHTSENENYQLYQYPVNAKEKVNTFGGSLGLSYYFDRHWSAKANFTYSEIDTSNLTDPIIPGYNTPKHKLNFGITGKDIYKGIGFGFNYKWCQGFIWESPFADGYVPSYALFDFQIRYNINSDDNSYRSSIKLGASNILNNRHIEAFGGPRVGRLIYLSWTYDITP
jgi:outer membrane cobalamin receptor